MSSVIMVILVLWAVVATSAMFDRQSALERARSTGANLAAAFSDQLAHTLDGISAEMDLLAQEIRTQGTDLDLQAWTHTVPLLALGTIQVAIIGPDGRLIASSLDANARGLDLSDRAHFRVHLDGSFKGLYVSEPVVGRVSKQTTLNITRRVETEDGRLLGVLMFAVPPRKLTTLLDLVEVGDRSTIALLGTDGLLRARFSRASPEGTVQAGLKLPTASRLDVAADDAHGTYVTSSTIDQVERLYSYRRVPRYPLVANVGLDLQEALAATATRTWSLVVLTIAGTLLLAGLAALLVREIDRRAERENEVAAERTLLQDAVESISEGFVIYDRDDRPIMLNEPYRSLYGVPEDPNSTFESVARQGLAEGRILDAIGREEAWLAERLRQHRDCKESVEQRMSDGRWVLATDRRMRNGGIAGLRVDITALKRVQAALRESQERLIHSRQHLALAQAVSHVGSILRDFRTGVVEWSDGLYAILGAERGKVTPSLQTLMEFVHPEDRAAVLADREAAVRGEPQKLSEYRIVRPDGGVRVVQRNQCIIRDDEQGNIVHLLVAFQDVTEMREAENNRRALERQLHHSQKLEALGTLAGGIAHDLNNTLVPVITIAKLSLRHATPGSVEYEDLELIYRAGVRARDLVKQVVAFSRKDVANRRLFKVDEVLGEALSMLRPTIPSMIRVEASVAPVPLVMGDPTQIHQVIVNLMTNAAHAIGLKHGVISVSLEEIASSPRGKPGLIRLAVADTGCGMDEDTKRRIFDPFFTTKPVGEGSGLGLSVVHGIVANHNGSIAVETAPGRGTRFVIDLPIAAREADADAAQQRSVA